MYKKTGHYENPVNVDLIERLKDRRRKTGNGGWNTNLMYCLILYVKVKDLVVVANVMLVM